MPFVRPLTKRAVTVQSTEEIPGADGRGVRDRAVAAQRADVRGLSRSTTCSWRRPDISVGRCRAGRRSSAAPRRRAGRRRRDRARRRAAERRRAPGDHGRHEPVLGPRRAGAARAGQTLGVPVFLNGLARGCVPADHELFFSRTRGQALSEADVALVIGVPLDFRLGFGGAFGPDTEIVAIDVAEPERAHPRAVAAECYGRLEPTLRDLIDGGRREPLDSAAWLERLRAAETEKRAAEDAERQDGRAPLHPMRLYKELGEVLDRNAIIVGDGGDFVSYAGRVIDSYEPGLLARSRPLRVPGLGARLRAGGQARPPRPSGRAAARRRRVRVLGPGVRHVRAARHRRRGRDGQQRHLGAGEAPDGVPVRLLRGRRAAARARATTRSWRRSAATASSSRSRTTLKPALARAFEAGRPALVNVLTDPTVAYPRRANLA